MAIEYCSQEELEIERTPSQLWDWLVQKVNQICSTEKGLKNFRRQEGLIKQLVEEVSPLAIWGKFKFGDTDQVLLKPIIGNQNYDAKIIDKRIEPATITYIEITQAHEGENDYLRRCELLNRGIVFSNAPVIKTGKGKNRKVLIPPEATSVEEGVKKELNRIVDAVKRKVAKDYPVNTSLIISFDDTTLFEERLKVLNFPSIDDFVKKEIIYLDIRFSRLYLVGEASKTFKEYPINRLI
jgi:hypothetical protein